MRTRANRQTRRIRICVSFRDSTDNSVVQSVPRCAPLYSGHPTRRRSASIRVGVATIFHTRRRDIGYDVCGIRGTWQIRVQTNEPRDGSKGRKANQKKENERGEEEEEIRVHRKVSFLPIISNVGRRVAHASVSTIPFDERRCDNDPRVLRVRLSRSLLASRFVASLAATGCCCCTR